MKKECCSFTEAEERGFGESWSKYKAAVFIYAPLETKKVVKLLLRQYLLEEDSSEGMHAYIHTYVRYLHTYHTYISGVDPRGCMGCCSTPPDSSVQILLCINHC